MFYVIIILVGIASLYLGIRSGFSVGYNKGVSDTNLLLSSLLVLIKKKDKELYNTVNASLKDAEQTLKVKLNL